MDIRIGFNEELMEREKPSFCEKIKEIGFSIRKEKLAGIRKKIDFPGEKSLDFRNRKKLEFLFISQERCLIII